MFKFCDWLLGRKEKTDNINTKDFVVNAKGHGYSMQLAANTCFPIYNAVCDPIDFDNYDFDEISKYVEFASCNLYIITVWDRYTGEDFSVYDVIVCQYFQHKGKNHNKEDIRKMSKILQEARIAINKSLENPLC